MSLESWLDMLSENEYLNLILSDKRFNKEQLEKVLAYEDMIYKGKLYFDMIPKELVDLINNYDDIMNFLANIEEDRQTLNTRYALGRYKEKIDEIKKRQEDSLKKIDLENELALKLINKNEGKKGYTIASLLIGIVVIMGVLLSIGLLSIHP